MMRGLSDKLEEQGKLPGSIKVRGRTFCQKKVSPAHLIPLNFYYAITANLLSILVSIRALRSAQLLASPDAQ